ncbi:tripartite tricarboxylate transporter substrate binding protein [Pollutimonas sp. H1-120]|uniref:Bug family tripartite tricarboxylate transporter substrate binding protein n=1 Tax=Pollutimonas sp. H1-120 TaxID=3148824 RepID=UPI003B51C62E
MKKKLYTALSALVSIASATALAGNPAFAADGFPNQPIRLIVPFSPGGSTDIVARYISKELGDELGQPVVIENRPGATGQIASVAVARAKPDGHTLIMATTSTHSISPYLHGTQPFDPIGDFEPISNVALLPFVLVATPKLQVSSVKDLIQLAKAKPGSISYASSGNGSSLHLASVLLTSMADVNMMHVPYKGAAPAVTDVMGGQVAVMFDTIPSSLPNAQAGKLKILAVSSPERSQLLPNVPTIAETGLPGYEVVGWAGLLAPKGTSSAVIEKINIAVNKILQTPEMRERFTGQGAEPAATTQSQFAALMKAEDTKWQKVIKESGIKAQ